MLWEYKVLFGIPQITFESVVGNWGDLRWEAYHIHHREDHARGVPTVDVYLKREKITDSV